MERCLSGKPRGGDSAEGGRDRNKGVRGRYGNGKKEKGGLKEDMRMEEKEKGEVKEGMRMENKR